MGMLTKLGKRRSQIRPPIVFPLCGRVGAAWLVTGPILNTRVRPRRMALLGPEARH